MTKLRLGPVVEGKRANLTIEMPGGLLRDLVDYGGLHAKIRNLSASASQTFDSADDRAVHYGRSRIRQTTQARILGSASMRLPVRVYEAAATRAFRAASREESSRLHQRAVQRSRLAERSPRGSAAPRCATQRSSAMMISRCT